VAARGAPCVVFFVQALDSLAGLDRNRRRGASFGLATPECSEPASMPLEDGFRRHDRQGIAPARPPPAEGDPAEATGVSDHEAWIAGFVHRELSAEGHVFKNELVVRAERGQDQTAYDEQEVWHRQLNGGGGEGTAKETNILSCGERGRSSYEEGQVSNHSRTQRKSAPPDSVSEQQPRSGAHSVAGAAVRSRCGTGSTRPVFAMSDQIRSLFEYPSSTLRASESIKTSPVSGCTAARNSLPGITNVRRNS
jgi:hypothetical protein